MKLPDMLKADVAAEVEAIKEYNKAIKLCIDEGDNATRQLLDGILLQEEDHKLEFERFLEVLEKVGDKKGAIMGLMQAFGKKE